MTALDLYNNLPQTEVQRSAYQMIQELVETSTLTWLRNAMKCANHSPNKVLTADMLEAVLTIQNREIL
jgi:histone H3/H4